MTQPGNEQEQENLKKPEAGGVKFDEGKLRYDLVPPEFLEGVAGPTTFGARKYAPRNWEKGISEDRLLGAAFRHIEAHRKGEIIDPETGLYHLDHAAWNLLAASTFRKRAKNPETATES